MRYLLAGFIVSAILAMGCAQGEQQALKRSAEEGVERAGTVVSESVDQAGTALARGVSTTKVKSTLLASPKLDASKINVDTKGSTVYLRGSVSSQQQRKLAVQLAQAMLEKDQALVDELEVGVVVEATPQD